MAEYLLTVTGGEKKRSLPIDGGETLLAALRRAGFEPDAPCGGLGKCGKCAVTVTGLCRLPDGTVREYSSMPVNACGVYPAGELFVALPEKRAESVLTGARDIPGAGAGLGLAVDIGTTTVAAYLYDLATGRCLAQAGEPSAQRAFGGDVISRIQSAATDAGLQAQRDAVRAQIFAMAKGLAGDISRIKYVSVAGNTVMEHLFAGLSPAAIGVAPYVPEHFFGEEYAAAEFFAGFAENCRLYICPAVAGFVGGDITAGLLSCALQERSGTALFLDVGTNGELALGGRDGIYCCSAAAGPAFEGGEIECGSSARVGAIYAVDRDMRLSVIGGGRAQSICGSGLIDAAAALLDNGALDETGRLSAGRVELANGVYVSARDIRQLQLAKAAVRAGIDTLLELAGVNYAGIGAVYIAGGFGAALNVESACRIGMLPAEVRGKTRYVGNSSGMGAALALTEEGRAALDKIRAMCRYEELTVSPLFGEKYISSMMFGEPEEEI